MNTNHDAILLELEEVIRQRKKALPDSSYTSSLMHKGLDAILKKLGEEATELVIAGKGGAREQIVYESADLFYHALVLLAYADIPLQDIYAELHRRAGTSGIAEKASRTK